MDKILRIVSDISQPLGIAGILAAAIFVVFRQIIKKNIFPILTKNLSAQIITLIVNRLSLLALVSIVLGFAGFAMSFFYKERPAPSPKLTLTQNVILRGHVIDARTAAVIRGAKITVTAQDKTLIDESDSKGVFVVRLQLPTDDLTVDLRVEAKDHVAYFEHQVLATASQTVALARIDSPMASRNGSETNKNASSSPTDRSVAGIEISYQPSSSQWSAITKAYQNLHAPTPDMSYSMTPMTAERIREYWVITFDAIKTERGMFQFSQVSTEQPENRRFEDVINAALTRLSVVWNGLGESTVDPQQSKFPAAVKIRNNQISLTLRPPQTVLNANLLKANSSITLRGEGDISNLTIRSLDPGIVLDQNLHIDWRRNPTADTAKIMPYVAGPYSVNVDLTTAAAAVKSDETKILATGTCESGACGNLICSPNPGYCVPCGDCGDVCCTGTAGSREKTIGSKGASFALQILSVFLLLFAHLTITRNDV